MVNRAYQLKVKKAQEEANAGRPAAKPATKRGGKRAGAGPPKGRRLSPVTRERLRGAIDVKRVIGHLDAMMSGQMIVDPHQVSAAKILLDRVMPTLAATDLTSGGESIVIERATFKPRL